MNTGVFGGNTISGAGIIPLGSVDDTWTVKFPNGNSFVNTFSSDWPYPGQNLTCARWISPEPTITSQGNSSNPSCFICSNITPDGIYQYRMSFTPNSSCNIASAKIVFSYCTADNELLQLKLNNSFSFNYPVPGYQTLPNFNTWNPIIPYTINLNPNDILLGNVNTIDLFVKNNNQTGTGNPWTITGLAICAYLQIDYENSLAPNIAGALNTQFICQNSPINVSGYAGQGVTPTNFQWQIQECNASGVPINNQNVWTSQIFSGSPGTYTFPPINFITCNKYYLITLKVSSICQSNVVATKKIYISCLPPITVTPDQTICQGQCAFVEIINPDPNYIYQVNLGGIIGQYSGTVCPSATTTYYGIVTNPSNDCQNFAPTTVFVDVINPNFNLTINNSSPNFMQLSATPIQISNLPQSFTYAWYVDELDAVGNVVFSCGTLNGPSCWVNFPSALTHDFGGFDGQQPFLNMNCLPTIGEFKYNTNYRISRVTASSKCKSKASVIISSNYGGYGQKSKTISSVLELSKNDEANINEISNIRIYPNPTTNMINFSVDSSNEAEIKVRIFDMFGKNLATSQISSANMEGKLDLSGYNNGFYILQFYKNEVYIGMRKIIIQK